MIKTRAVLRLPLDQSQQVVVFCVEVAYGRIGRNVGRVAVPALPSRQPRGVCAVQAHAGTPQTPVLSPPAVQPDDACRTS